MINKIEWLKQESDLSIKSMITDRIGQHKVLLPINHNCYIFQKQKICLGQTCAVETTSKEKIPQLWKFHNIFGCGCCYGYCDQFCDWWIWQKGLNLIDFFNCPITGVQLQPTVQLHCLITTLQNNLWKTKQLLHQSHLRKL